MSDDIRTFKNKETGEVRTFRRKKAASPEGESSAESKSTSAPAPEKPIGQRIADGMREGTDLILKGISNAPSEGMLKAIAGGPQNNIADAIKQIALDRAIPSNDFVSTAFKGAVKEGTNPVNLFMGLQAKSSFGKKLGPAFPKSSQIDEAADMIDNDLATLKRVNGEKQFRLSDEVNTLKLQNKIKDSTNISNLENQKTNVAYSQAEAIHGNPVDARGGDIGLGLKASKNLNKAYWKDAEPLMTKELYVEDVKEGIKTTLQKNGILDGNGSPIPNAEMSADHAKVLNFYQSLNKADEPGVINALKDVEKITAGELKLKLEVSFGKSAGGSNLVKDVWSESSQYVKEINDLNSKYVTDYQARNAVFDKFNIFNKMGWRKGDVSLKGGSDLLKNLASEDASLVNRDSLKLMGFLKKYTGVDPSQPVVGLGNKIKSINQTAASRDIADKIKMADMDRSVFDQELTATKDALATKEALGKLKLSALVKEAKEAAKQKWIKRAKIAGAIAAADQIPAVRKVRQTLLPL